MKKKLYKFNQSLDMEFTKTLRERVNEYFSEKNMSKYANGKMIFKTIIMFAMFFVPYFIMISGIISNIWILFGMWMIMGVGMAGIGANVAHDALHGSYSRNKNVNKLLGFAMDIMGASGPMWKIQHNVLHHTYTNVEHVDDDIDTPLVLRFSPNKKWYKIHKYQHIYAWFFYSISTLYWVTVKNFVQVWTYWKRNQIKTKTNYRLEYLKLIGWKVFYFGYILVVPMLLIPVAPWLIILMFISLQMVCGVVLSTIFQPAHVNTAAEFIDQEEPEINHGRMAHQLLTTANFAPKNKLVSWFTGGLNFQIEHHLFPNICHVHYSKISEIVKQTAKEYNLPYYTQESFRKAIKDHVQFLKSLGRNEMVLSTIKS